jgi:hypothetical protein
MTSLTTQEMTQIEGGGFWGGFACGLSAVGSLVLWTSPDPFSKLAALSYSATAIGCITAYL